ncbi:tyrosyl-DNA phosphodiesterase 1-like isoform X3 [Ostrea edulis]|uniref:tyrosyl-DNA phosphodiesterase 1-like isoform X2 n=1 Tax=Ostrea edulis TaxID=37623 RepID=UPI0024AF0F36|nr:tyrosyl-DNA phosphodiesterase 1-like isoform X2 [Ostrea edulis]XP_056022717.1 tyrosyl-DNA phosphodiesterase 1-like isoform X3 [Ostrea edulis]
MSDTDSDATIEPDPSDWDSPLFCNPSPTKPTFPKRQSTNHQLSDSEDEEPKSVMKQPATIRRQNTQDFLSGRTSPKLLKKVNKHVMAYSPISTSQKDKNSSEFKKTSDQNNSARGGKSGASKSVPETRVKDCPSLKRKHSSSDSSSRGLVQSACQSIPPCQYGSNCYRKNPAHFKEFSHPSPADDDGAASGSKTRQGPVSPPMKRQKTGTMALTSKEPVAVFDHAQPMSFFLTKVNGISSEYNGAFTMSLKDILSESMGNLQESCQFNYMFEIPWLMQQYPASFKQKPLLCVHGFQGGQKAGLEADARKFTNIKFCQARLEMPYGTHHTKMMFLLYDNGLRVVIHTANLIERDWHQKTQGIWISPVFPKLKSGPSLTQGDSPTHFKRDLLQYVTAYKAYQLKDWQDHIARHDLSTANVFIVGSVPGRHMADKKHCFGHMKLRKLLHDHGPLKEQASKWPVIGQFSSIGSLGASKENWLSVEFLQSLATVKGTSSIPLASVPLKLIFPSVDNVRTSLEGYPAGGSIPYSINVAKKQPWLQTYFHQWRSEGRGRNRAMPHIKTYCRPSPDWGEAAWFLVTSSNLSKAAWGALEKKGSQLMIRSFEIGVLFVPQFLNGKSVFKCSSKLRDAEQKSFVLPYDLPPRAYTKEDEPWIWDIAHKELPDSNGNMWCPS